MAVTVAVKFKGTAENYDAVQEKGNVESDPPEGLLIHTAAVKDDGTIQVIDVWESADAFGKFAQERLSTAIPAVMGDDFPEVEPEITELHNVLKP